MSTENYEAKHDLVQSGWPDSIVQNEISFGASIKVPHQSNK